VVAIVGYTNAGKSTLFNNLTDAEVLVEDRLFATLDSTVRKLSFPGGREALMSDTVGFVRRLPHELVEAFRSTLEEVNDADVLVHLVDGADRDPDRQIEAVRQVLRDIGAGEIEELLVVNKTDIAAPEAVERLLKLNPNAVAISAARGEGLTELNTAIVDRIDAGLVQVSLLIPYERGDALAAAHRLGEVIHQQHLDGGTALDLRLPAYALYEFEDFTAT
jgi:GTP-binding protein HflX